MSTQQTNIDWHRLFGIAFEQDFVDYTWLWIEREKDMAITEQLLDILVVYMDDADRQSSFLKSSPKPLPDGLDNLSHHNLITYKSLRESLNEWALQELIGHYVNYRKAVPSKEGDKLLPASHFQLYAICTRFPQKLMKKYSSREIQQGVYDIVVAGLTVRIIVLSRIPKAKHNAIWNLFSNVVENIEYGLAHYEPKLEEMSSTFDMLFEFYELEGIHVAYSLEQFEKDHFLYKAPKMLKDEEVQSNLLNTFVKNLSLEKILSKFLNEEQTRQLSFEHIFSVVLNDERLRKFSIPQLLSRLSPAERLEGLSTDERLEGLSTDERLEGLSTDERLEGLSTDERLEGLSPDEIQAYMKRIEEN